MADIGGPNIQWDSLEGGTDKCSWVYECVSHSADKKFFTCRPLSDTTPIPDGVVPGRCLTFTTEQLPKTVSHNINTHIQLIVPSTSSDIVGYPINLLKTIRKHSHSHAWKKAVPAALKRYNNHYIGCNYSDPSWTTSISEDCSIEKSTLHYLDLANNVVLYRKVIEKVKFSGSSDVSGYDETVLRKGTARFRAGGVVGNIQYFNKVMIPLTNESHATGSEAWILYNKGREHVISVSTYDIPAMPWSGPLAYENDIGIVTDMCTNPSSQKYSIFIFPWPSSRDVPRDEDIYCNGFYDYGSDPSELNDLDGGNRDMFYPQWCRALHQDPVWAMAAKMRVEAYLMEAGDRDVVIGEHVDTRNYTYPDGRELPQILIGGNLLQLLRTQGQVAPILTKVYPNLDIDYLSVDPIPLGSFAKHPELEAVYQFLTTDRNGVSKLTTSPNINDILDEKLAPLKTHDTTLYYPISLY